MFFLELYWGIPWNLQYWNQYWNGFAWGSKFQTSASRCSECAFLFQICAWKLVHLSKEVILNHFSSVSLSWYLWSENWPEWWKSSGLYSVWAIKIRKNWKWSIYQWRSSAPTLIMALFIKAHRLDRFCVKIFLMYRSLRLSIFFRFWMTKIGKLSNHH